MINLTQTEAMFLARQINTCLRHYEVTLPTEQLQNEIMPIWVSAQMFIEAGLRNTVPVHLPVEVNLDSTMVHSIMPIVEGWVQTMEENLQYSFEWATACQIKRRLHSVLN